MTNNTFKRYMIGYITPTHIEYYSYYTQANGGTYAFWTVDPMSAVKFQSITDVREYIDHFKTHVCPPSVTNTDTVKLTIFEIGPAVVSHLIIPNYAKKEADRLVDRRSKALNKLTHEERVLLGLERII